MNKKFLIILFLVAGILFGNFAYAQELPPGQPITLGGITDIVVTIVNSLLGIGAIVSVGFITWAGITWMAAGGDEGKVKDAKARLKAGIWGAVIVLGVFVIIFTIENVVSRQFFDAGYGSGSGGPGAPCDFGSQCRSGSCVTRPNGIDRWCL